MRRTFYSLAPAFFPTRTYSILPMIFTGVRPMTLHRVAGHQIPANCECMCQVMCVCTCLHILVYLLKHVGWVRLNEGLDLC